MAVKDLVEYSQFFWPRRKTKYGLMGMIAACAIMGFYVPIRDSWLEYRAVGVGLASAVILVWWLVHSGRIVLPSRRVKVALALRSLDPETQLVVEKVIALLRIRLDTLKLTPRFKILEIGTDKIDTVEQAERYIRRWKINLLLHGIVIKAQHESVQRYDLRNTFWTYLIAHSDPSPAVSERVKEDVMRAMPPGEWIIDESNELKGLELVVDNLVQVLLSAIAIGLSQSFLHMGIAATLIEALLPWLEVRLTTNDRQVSIRQSDRTLSISKALFRTGRLRGILHECYLGITRKYIWERKYREASSVLEKALLWGLNPIDSYMGLARCSFELGDVVAARGYTDRIKEINSRHPSCHLNYAFFALREQRFEVAVDHYESLRRMAGLHRSQMIRDAIAFLIEQCKRTDDTLYLFGAGLLAYNHVNKADGKRLLTEFLDGNVGQPKRLLLIERVKRILRVN